MMALLEDLLESNLGIMAVVGTAAIVLPKVFPDLSPPIRSAIKSGLQLYLESESEAEGGFIGKMVDATMQHLLDNLSKPGTDQERRQAVQQTIQRFQHRARTRAHRYGWSDEDRRARYRRQIRRLKQALAVAQQGRDQHEREILGHVYDGITEDW